jgi:hypothetical protein
VKLAFSILLLSEFLESRRTPESSLRLFHSRTALQHAVRTFTRANQ